MRRHPEGSLAPPGIFVSLKHLDVRVVEGTGERLRGRPGASYWRVPFAWLVVAGPVLGAVFAMAFPVVVFYAVVSSMGQWLRSPRRSHRVRMAGDKVREGVYLGTNRLSMRYVGAPDEPLPGREGTRYVRLPTWLLLLLSPVLGGLFVVAFPLIAAVTLLAALAHAFWDAGRAAWHRGERLEAMRWDPASPEPPKTLPAERTER